MVEDDLMYSTLGEVYEFDCARHGRDSYEQMSYFKEKLNPATVDRRSPEDVAKLRREIYDNIINLEYVSDRIFTQYMYKILPSCDLLWLFRKEFAVQLALSGFVSYTLQIGERVSGQPGCDFMERNSRAGTFAGDDVGDSQQNHAFDGQRVCKRERRTAGSDGATWKWDIIFIFLILIL